MIKRILAGAAAAGFAASLFAATPSAWACAGAGAEPNWNSDDLVTTAPGTGSKVYGAQDGTGGYLGVTGGTGWIKAEGGAPGGGSVTGANSTGAVNGRITVGNPPHACVNGQGA